MRADPLELPDLFIAFRIDWSLTPFLSTDTKSYHSLLALERLGNWLPERRVGPVGFEPTTNQL